MSTLQQIHRAHYEERRSKVMRSFHQMRHDEMAKFDTCLLIKFRLRRSYNVIQRLVALHT